MFNSFCPTPSTSAGHHDEHLMCGQIEWLDSKQVGRIPG